VHIGIGRTADERNALTVAHHEPAPYTEATDPAYAERAAETFTLRKAGPDLLVPSTRLPAPSAARWCA
jgi:hypothetical protein